MSTTTFGNVVRAGVKSSNPCAGSMMLAQEFSFDPTAAAGTGTGKYLPSGAQIVWVWSDGGATGGTNPTYDLGYTGDADGILNEADADGVVLSSALLTTATTAEVEILAGVGASAPTGGTVRGAIGYYLVDPKSGVFA